MSKRIAKLEDLASLGALEKAIDTADKLLKAKKIGEVITNVVNPITGDNSIQVPVSGEMRIQQGNKENWYQIVGIAFIGGILIGYIIGKSENVSKK
jgi:hypothetical protein